MSRILALYRSLPTLTLDLDVGLALADGTLEVECEQSLNKCLHIVAYPCGLLLFRTQLPSCEANPAGEMT